jgi:nicotinamidase/pyrazinamidase
MSGNKPALLIVDAQNDFCQGGSLAVEGGDEVVPLLNEYAKRFRERGYPVYASRDWHPSMTRHFKEFGGLWPPHCVQGTAGAAFHPGLEPPPADTIVTAGDSPNDEGYSAFEGHMADGESFGERLRRDAVTHLFMGGIATDYCVRASALDARRLGFDVTVLVDAVRAVELEPGDADRAIREMVNAGAVTATLDTFELG